MTRPSPASTPTAVSNASGSVVKRVKRQSPYARLGGHAARLVLAIFFAFPVVFMFVSSLKPDDQIFADLGSIKAFLPVGHISFDNYSKVFDTVPAGRFLFNSIAISVVTVILGVIVNSLAAFALARMKWRGRSILLTAIVATLVVPFE